MSRKQKTARGQFRLRSLLLGIMWFALLLAVCVRYQQATTRQRQIVETLPAAGRLPAVRVLNRWPTSAVTTPTAPAGPSRGAKRARGSS